MGEIILEIVTLFLFAAFFIFCIVLIYNIYLNFREKIIRFDFKKPSNEAYDYKKAAEWLQDKLKVFSKEKVYLFAGEFNHDLYNEFLNDKLKEILREKQIKLVLIGGPYISVHTKNDISPVIEWAKDGLIDLHIRKDHKRTIGHGLVAEKSSQRCLLEDPHDEYEERAITMFEDSPNFCSALRKKVSHLLSDNITFKLTDYSNENISKYLRTKDEIQNQKNMKIVNDERLEDPNLVNPLSNPLLENRRLKCLARIV